MNKRLTKEEKRIIFLFLLLPVCLMIIFGLLPVFMLIYNSFTDWDGLSSEKNFIGFTNYLTIFKNPIYFAAFKNNLYYLGSGLLQIVLALLLAVLLSTKTRGKTVFKAFFVFPILISGVAVSMIFRLFFEPDGSFDQLLNFLHLNGTIRYWLGDPRIVNLTLAFISLWRHLGTSFLLYFAAVQSIPEVYYRAAELEGASFWQQLRWIILPNIRTVLKLNFVLLTIGAVSAFEIPLVMTNGSNGTMTFLLQTMKTAFDQKLVGLGSAMAVLMTLLIIALSLVQQKFQQEETT
ncbi:carbohydrate ABC transporter permease [Enterococcus sp. LJL128]|uniref:carbohydrate ABC transporter permease n=1 Tax=Enterococcus sp. LJL51 TaxID=3416656 RepID=UPI003CE9DB50